MSAHPPVEELEALTAEAAAHVAQCETCAREVAWLRAEKALVARRPAVAVAGLWEGVASRLQASGLRLQAVRIEPEASVRGLSRRRVRWARRVGVAATGVAAAAAVVLFALRPKAVPVAAQAPVAGVWQAPVSAQAAQRDDFRPDPKALAALDRAEADYRDAAKVLEAEYNRLRPQLDPALAKRWDETLSRAHTQLGEARVVAGDDVNARMQVLDGYAGYLRSLRNVVRQSGEANP